MDKNRVVPSCVLFLALFIAEIYAVVQFRDNPVVPLVICILLLASAWFSLSELLKFEKMLGSSQEPSKEDDQVKYIKAAASFQKKTFEFLSEELYELEKKIPSTYDDSDVKKHIKATIKFERENTKQLISTMRQGIEQNAAVLESLSNSVAELKETVRSTETASERGDEMEIAESLREIAAKLDTLTEAIKNIPSANVQYAASPAAGAENISPAVTEEVPVMELEPELEMSAEPYEEAVSEMEIEPAVEAPAEPVSESEPVMDIEAEETPIPEAEPISEPEPVVTPVSDDPNHKMSPDEIAALFAGTASSEPELEPVPEPEPEPEPVPKPITPVSDDPNHVMTPDEIAALIASAGN